MSDIGSNGKNPTQPEAAFGAFSSLRPNDILKIDGRPWRVVTITAECIVDCVDLITGSPHTLTHHGIAYAEGPNA